MNTVDAFQQQSEQVRHLLKQGDIAGAEKLLLALTETSEVREQPLVALLELYMQTQRPLEAISTLEKLVIEKPDSLLYLDRLAGMLSGFGQLGVAISHYQKFIRAHEDNANAWFNLALLYKRGKRFLDAIDAYEKSLSLGISDIHEVYSNMGVLYSDMRQAENARKMYEQAIEIQAQYLPALFNLAGLAEEEGQREEASAIYRDILKIDPDHHESMSRLAYLKKITAEDSELLATLEQAAGQPSDSVLGKESVHFALGKSYDDLGRYEQAMSAYRQANALGKTRNREYRRADVEAGFDQLIEVFSPSRLAAAKGDSRVSPIFVCGMFRSGSTLLEQVLSTHPAMTAGGELDFFQWLVFQNFTPYPQRIENATEAELHALGYQYLSMLKNLFPTATHLTDKQPDNFLFLGLVKMLYPSAKILYTKRRPRDNCLSVYFQQLGANLNYATSISDTGHYYQQHSRLMQHWQSCFSENIHTVEYEALVNSPEATIRDTLDFLGLEWAPACLDFTAAANPVKTASVWQVREGLHKNSAGRWRNYEAFANELSEIDEPA